MAATGERVSSTDNEAKVLSWDDGWKFIFWSYVGGTVIVLVNMYWPR